MNIMINSYCNLHCSYCFAQDTMHNATEKNMSLENFDKILNWMIDNNLKQVRLIGGEPTLHPQLEQFIDLVISKHFFDNIHIFSNFTFNEEIRNMLLKKMKDISITFLPNINELNLLAPSLRQSILNNIEIMYSLTNLDTISINMYSPTMNLTFWEDLICKYNIKRIRFSITIPNKSIEKDFNFYDFYHSFQPLLLQLCDFAANYGITLGNDCNPMPICCYDDWAIVKMLKIAPQIFERVFCDSSICDIKPDLSVLGCFGTSINRNDIKLTDLSSYSEIQRLTSIANSNKYKGVARKECLSCERYLTYGQSCGCLVYRQEI